MQEQEPATESQAKKSQQSQSQSSTPATTQAATTAKSQGNATKLQQQQQRQQTTKRKPTGTPRYQLKGAASQKLQCEATTTDNKNSNVASTNDQAISVKQPSKASVNASAAHDNSRKSEAKEESKQGANPSISESTSAPEPSHPKKPAQQQRRQVRQQQNRKTANNNNNSSQSNSGPNNSSRQDKESGSSPAEQQVATQPTSSKQGGAAQRKHHHQNATTKEQGTAPTYSGRRGGKNQQHKATDGRADSNTAPDSITTTAQQKSCLPNRANHQKHSKVESANAQRATQKPSKSVQGGQQRQQKPHHPKLKQKQQAWSGKVASEALTPAAEEGTYDSQGFYIYADGSFLDPDGYFFDKWGFDELGGHYDDFNIYHPPNEQISTQGGKVGGGAKSAHPHHNHPSGPSSHQYGSSAAEQDWYADSEEYYYASISSQHCENSSYQDPTTYRDYPLTQRGATTTAVRGRDSQYQGRSQQQVSATTSTLPSKRQQAKQQAGLTGSRQSTTVHPQPLPTNQRQSNKQRRQQQVESNGPNNRRLRDEEIDFTEDGQENAAVLGRHDENDNENDDDDGDYGVEDEDDYGDDYDYNDDHEFEPSSMVPPAGGSKGQQRGDDFYTDTDVADQRSKRLTSRQPYGGPPQGRHPHQTRGSAAQTRGSMRQTATSSRRGGADHQGTRHFQSGNPTSRGGRGGARHPTYSKDDDLKEASMWQNSGRPKLNPSTATSDPHHPSQSTRPEPKHAPKNNRKELYIASDLVNAAADEEGQHSSASKQRQRQLSGFKPDDFMIYKRGGVDGATDEAHYQQQIAQTGRGRGGKMARGGAAQSSHATRGGNFRGGRGRPTPKPTFAHYSDLTTPSTVGHRHDGGSLQSDNIIPFNMISPDILRVKENHSATESGLNQREFEALMLTPGYQQLSDDLIEQAQANSDGKFIDQLAEAKLKEGGITSIFEMQNAIMSMKKNLEQQPPSSVDPAVHMQYQNIMRLQLSEKLKQMQNQQTTTPTATPGGGMLDSQEDGQHSDDQKLQQLSFANGGGAINDLDSQLVFAPSNHHDSDRDNSSLQQASYPPNGSTPGGNHDFSSPLGNMMTSQSYTAGGDGGNNDVNSNYMHQQFPFGNGPPSQQQSASQGGYFPLSPYGAPDGNYQNHQQHHQNSSHQQMMMPQMVNNFFDDQRRGSDSFNQDDYCAEEFRLRQSEISAMISDQEEEQSLFISSSEAAYRRPQPQQQQYAPQYNMPPTLQRGVSEYVPQVPHLEDDNDDSEQQVLFATNAKMQSDAAGNQPSSSAMNTNSTPFQPFNSQQAAPQIGNSLQLVQSSMSAQLPEVGHNFQHDGNFPNAAYGNGGMDDNNQNDDYGFLSPQSNNAIQDQNFSYYNTAANDGGQHHDEYVEEDGAGGGCKSTTFGQI